MKKSSILFGLLLLSSGLLAQLNPVSWTFSSEKVGEQEYELSFEADLKPGWYIYSQFLEEGGPIPTRIFLDVQDGFLPLGAAREEGEKLEGHDALFGMEIVKFKGKTRFIQRVQVVDPLQTITGYIEYMVCDEAKCLPPNEMEFVFELN